MQKAMNEVLAGLGIAGTCIDAKAHRHFVYYDIKLDKKASALNKLENSAREIALHLQTFTIPIVKVVSKEGIVRLQATTRPASPIKMMDLYKGENIPTDMVFPMMLGEDDTGTKLWMDMNHNPHLLVAGATSSGKSTLLHTLVANALFVDALRVRDIWLFLGDPKRVEFEEYKDPSLSKVVKHIANSYEDVVAQLELLYEMMELRYTTMNKIKMRSVEQDPNKFPVAFCIIDEVADLMMIDKKKGNKMQDLIVQIAQKGRAAGIFLCLATQRPSVDVITGLIKANFPGRIACRTSSRKDSEVILDRGGAETLMGRGDALLQNMKHESVRFQVSYTEPLWIVRDYNKFVQHVQGLKVG